MPTDEDYTPTDEEMDTETTTDDAATVGDDFIMLEIIDGKIARDVGFNLLKQMLREDPEAVALLTDEPTPLPAVTNTTNTASLSACFQGRRRMGRTI